jgi:hypothetical protein
MGLIVRADVSLLSAEEVSMSNREVGRARAARNRVQLHCERLEARETPSATTLVPSSGAAAAAVIVQATGSDAVQTSAPATQADSQGLLGGTSIDPAAHQALFAQAQFTSNGTLDAAPASSLASVTGTTRLTASTTAPTPGQSVTLTATVTAWGMSGKAWGTVTFKDGSVTLGRATLINGVARFTWWNATTGAHTITAVYSGGGAVRASTSAAVRVTVGKSTLQLTPPSSSVARPVAGNPLSLYVSYNVLTRGATARPSGRITFKDGSTVLGTVPINPWGRTELRLSGLSTGTHTITAVYSGDANFNWTTSASFTVTVATNKVTTRLSAPSYSNAHPSAGTPVTLSVSLTLPWGTRLTPGGTVTFKDGNTFLGTVVLNPYGPTRLTVTNLAAGWHSIVAIYSGDGHFFGTTSSASLYVSAPAPGKTYVSLSTPLASNAHPTQGSGVTFAVSFRLGSTSAYTPTGTVTFKDGNTVLGTVRINPYGQTQFTTYGLAVGSHSMTAVYSGDAHFFGATSGATWVTVSQPLPPGQSPVEVHVAPVGSVLYANFPLVLQVVVTSPGGTPSGWVTFMEGTRTWGRIQLDSHGKGALAIGIGLPLGTHYIAAYYDGNAHFASGGALTGFTLTQAPMG